MTRCVSCTRPSELSRADVQHVRIVSASECNIAIDLNSDYMPRVVKHAHTKLLPCKSNIGEVNRSSGRFIKGKTYPSDLRQISTFEIYQGNTDALLNGMQLVSSPDWSS